MVLVAIGIFLICMIVSVILNISMIIPLLAGIIIAGLVPWCIACSVPLAMMGVNYGAVPFAFYLWLIPIYYLIRLRFGSKSGNRAS